MSKEAKQRGHPLPDSIRESDLKICDLCGCLNLTANPDCFVCGWHGRFERSPDIIRASLEVAIRQHGRLELHHLTDPDTYTPPPPPNLQSRFFVWMDRLWDWLCG